MTWAFQTGGSGGREVRHTKITSQSLESQLPRWRLQYPQYSPPEAPLLSNRTTWRKTPNQSTTIVSTMKSYTNMAVLDSTLGCLTYDKIHNGSTCIVLQSHLVLIVSSVITYADLMAQRGRLTSQEVICHLA